MERGGSLRARYLQGENELRGGTGYLRCAARNLSSADATHHMGRESERARERETPTSMTAFGGEGPPAQTGLVTKRLRESPCSTGIVSTNSRS